MHSQHHTTEHGPRTCRDTIPSHVAEAPMGGRVAGRRVARPAHAPRTRAGRRVLDL